MPGTSPSSILRVLLVCQKPSGSCPQAGHSGGGLVPVEMLGAPPTPTPATGSSNPAAPPAGRGLCVPCHSALASRAYLQAPTPNGPGDPHTLPVRLSSQRNLRRITTAPLGPRTQKEVDLYFHKDTINCPLKKGRP